MAPSFQEQADEYIARHAQEHDLAPLTSANGGGETSIRDTFQSGVTVRVWRWANGHLTHRTYG
jgi:hypothetical protein